MNRSIDPGAATNSAKPDNGAAYLPVTDSRSQNPDPLAVGTRIPTWINEAILKLEKLSQLPRNWDSYDGLPLSPSLKWLAHDALIDLKNQEMPVPAVVLASDGTVHFEWRRAGKSLTIGCGEHGSLEYSKMDEQGHIEEGETAVAKLRSLAKWVPGKWPAKQPDITGH